MHQGLCGHTSTVEEDGLHIVYILGATYLLDDEMNGRVQRRAFIYLLDLLPLVPLTNGMVPNFWLSHNRLQGAVRLTKCNIGGATNTAVATGCDSRHPVEIKMFQ